MRLGSVVMYISSLRAATVKLDYTCSISISISISILYLKYKCSISSCRAAAVKAGAVTLLINSLPDFLTSVVLINLSFIDNVNIAM